MEGWKYWKNKKVFIILKNKRTYSGIVLDVEPSKDNKFYFITLVDKFNKRISFINSEMEIMQEEE